MNDPQARFLPAKAYRSCILAGTILCCFLSPCYGDAQTSAAPTSSSTDADTSADRPHLKHQTERITDYGVADESSDAVVPGHAHKASGLQIAPGLYLPTKGTVWALDQFESKDQLVHLKYDQTGVNNHTASNLLKGSVVPFVFKQTKTIEVKGVSAAVRLHTTHPVIYCRSIYEGDEESSPDANAVTHIELAVVKLRVEGDKRLVSTVEFTQLTGKAARSEGRVEATAERIGDSHWMKITPKEALVPGEYGVVPLPKGQNLFSPVVYDFAIDPAAPANTNVVLAE